MLILDEPTSSLDIKTETEIVEAMERLMKGRTSFIIAHRSSLLKQSDVLLVVQNGRLLTFRSGIAAALDNLASGKITAVPLGPASNRSAVNAS
jgi:ABC-type transport system involved in cytochrome bd biosynthesis fused ATPase/permease subunit